MPAPIIWLGAGALALFAGAKYSTSQEFNDSVTTKPGDGHLEVIPVNGSIVCCGVYGVFDHTGIWVDGNVIELKGNGLIRGISASRFLQGRSGEKIYIACDANNQPLFTTETKNRAISKLFQYSEYDVLKNNCHKFVWECISGQSISLTRFTDLNQKMSEKFASDINWQSIAI